jgi:hypothetical protein
MTDHRLIDDPELEWEADHSGVIHLRKLQSKTQFLDGYGTTDFGMKSYIPRKNITPARLIIGAGIATAGFLGWRFRDGISTQSRTLGDLALIFRESLRS